MYPGLRIGRTSSGHFLVFALPILLAFRQAEEGLDERAAVKAVLADNFFGLEIDPRCTQIAAFALPGFRVLDCNVGRQAIIDAHAAYVRDPENACAHRQAMPPPKPQPDSANAVPNALSMAGPVSSAAPLTARCIAPPMQPKLHRPSSAATTAGATTIRTRHPASPRIS
jgi:hypothetical protein